MGLDQRHTEVGLVAGAQRRPFVISYESRVTLLLVPRRVTYNSVCPLNHRLALAWLYMLISLLYDAFPSMTSESVAVVGQVHGADKMASRL